MNWSRIHKLLSTTILIILTLGSCKTTKVPTDVTDLTYHKREFRGAWLSTAWQGRYKTMNSQQMKAYFVRSLDQLQADGINAIIFQVRPQADAFYKSKYEPWSAHLTGQQGLAPDSNFDPLAFVIEECHKRNMELHAWLNPYRVTSSNSDRLVKDHLYFREPDRFVNYDGKIYFDPGYPQNREYICDIVKDILFKYEVDAIHMDDYFYPYPIAGKSFPDQRSFNIYGKPDGFTTDRVGDWRRQNVNLLVKEVKQTIMEVKPWVRFGISPFGIYRNKKNTPDNSGSNTGGLQNYDDLYADVKLWIEMGWIDYNMPQLYWEIGHASAGYRTLIDWWAANNNGISLYIGQDVKRTMDAKGKLGEPSQLSEKMELSRSFPTVHGNCFWPAYELLDNYKGIQDELREKHHVYPALIPPYLHMHNKAPKRVGKLREEYTDRQHVLLWDAKSDKHDPETAQYFVVYRFAKGERENIHDARKIMGTTRTPYYVLPYEGGKTKYKYVVTAVDAFHNESKGRSKDLKL